MKTKINDKIVTYKVVTPSGNYDFVTVRDRGNAKSNRKIAIQTVARLLLISQKDLKAKRVY